MSLNGPHQRFLEEQQRQQQERRRREQQERERHMGFVWLQQRQAEDAARRRREAEAFGRGGGVALGQQTSRSTTWTELGASNSSWASEPHHDRAWIAPLERHPVRAFFVFVVTGPLALVAGWAAGALGFALTRSSGVALLVAGGAWLAGLLLAITTTRRVWRGV